MRPAEQQHPSDATDEAIVLTDVRKTYGDVVALAGVSLAIRAGEFFTMLGPSGSGKTTLLRVIAGFERADAGRVELHGRDVTNVPPYDRDVNTVFQDYALFPHMNVLQNVEYGMRVKRVPRADRRRRATEALQMVGLPEHGKRKPTQLSGGQRQRVALARAIVNRPSVLLLDEPLGALDLKLRQGMQLELKRIQREAGITFVFVTHDQEEALTMSDRIAIFSAGQIQQVGTPAQIYEAPATEYVANFIGVSNILDARGRRYSVRPERIEILTGSQPPPTDAIVEDAEICDVIYLGMVTRIRAAVGDRIVSAVRTNAGSALAFEVGERIRLAWRPEHAHELAVASAASVQTEEQRI